MSSQVSSALHLFVPSRFAPMAKMKHFSTQTTNMNKIFLAHRMSSPNLSAAQSILIKSDKGEFLIQLKTSQLFYLLSSLQQIFEIVFPLFI
jgi:hypothetical protein